MLLENFVFGVLLGALFRNDMETSTGTSST